MARTPTSSVIDATPEAPKRPGRPPMPFDYSRFKVAFRDPDQFARFLAGYPDMAGVLGYFYRLKPKIDLSLIGLAETSILKTANADQMNADFCRSTWGNGKYMLTLNDANRVKGQQEVARVWFEIDDPDLQAVYDPRSLLVNDPQNADEVARLLQSGVLVRDAVTGSPRVRTEGAHAYAAAPAAATVVPAALAPDLASAVMLKLLDRAFPSVASPTSPTEMLNQSFLIAERLNPAVAAPSLEQLADAVVARLKTTPPAGAPEDPFAVYERIDAVLSKFGAGRAVATEGGWQDTLVRSLVPLVAPLVPMLGQYLQNKGVPANPTVNALYRPPVAPAAIPAVTYDAAPKDGSGAGSGATEALIIPEAELIGRVIEVANLALLKQAGGVSGADFCSWLLTFHPGGCQIFDFLADKGGSPGCLSLMAMIPQCQDAVTDPVRRAALQAWLDDFFNAGLEADEVDESKAAA